MSAFKPGDVALVTGYFSHVAEPRIALRDPQGDGWQSVESLAWCSDHNVTDVRPLVVIDPEDAEQVERLADAWRAVDSVDLDETAMSLVAYRLQAALREFADPKPRIEEPTGLGAVVEDAKGTLWFRMALENQTWPGEVWLEQYADPDRWSNWESIAAVRVLSEGVTE